MRKKKFFIVIFFVVFCISNVFAGNKNWFIGRKDLLLFVKAIDAIEANKKNLFSRYSKKIENKDVSFLVNAAKYSYDDKTKMYNEKRILSFSRKKILPNIIEDSVFDKVDDITKIIESIDDVSKKNNVNKDKILVQTWIKSNFSKEQEDEFFRKYSKFLTKENHISRADRMLQINNFVAASRMKKHVPYYYRSIIDARISLKTTKKDAIKHIKQIPKGLLKEPGFIYDLALHKKQNSSNTNFNSNIELLYNITDHGSYSLKFWYLKRYYARELLYLNPQKNKISAIDAYQKAYKLASSHNLKSGVDFFDAEWLSGWIALRFLNNHRLALHHFNTLKKHVKRPISVSRASYWLGRVYEEMNQTGRANECYREAAKYFHTFYGQLAAFRLSGRSVVSMPNNKAISDDYNHYYNNVFNKYTFIALKANKNKLASALATIAIERAKSKGEIVIVVEKIMNFGAPDVALQAAKTADAHGIFIPEAMYPVLRVKNTKNVAHHLRMAIIRQESGFDKRALSTAGALGLMQVMPKTAAEVAEKIGIKYNKNLLLNPEYNINLGSFYLQDLLERYNQSMILTISSYNAGPANVDRWVRQMGGLSNLNIDERIDWIELIPFNETRNYVQRILENIQMYKYVLNGTNNKSANVISSWLVNDIK